MKANAVAIILAASLVFMGFVIYLTIQPVQVECEVCMDFAEGTVCRSGRGATEEEAINAGRESACGGNVTGMAELIACRGATPSHVQCVGP